MATGTTDSIIRIPGTETVRVSDDVFLVDLRGKPLVETADMAKFRWLTIFLVNGFQV
jgi:hypothetical protein